MERFDSQPKNKEMRGKPPLLYHGTLNNDIEEFEPRSAAERPDEAPAVYASPDLEIAIQSMANKFVSNGGILNGRKFVCIPMAREEFIKQDRGGTVYTFSNDSFEVNKGMGLGDKEWVSQKAIAPKEKVHFPSLLEAMLQQGTEVYFIKPDLITKITEAQNSDPQKLENILSNLKPEEPQIKTP